MGKTEVAMRVWYAQPLEDGLGGGGGLFAIAYKFELVGNLLGPIIDALFLLFIGCGRVRISGMYQLTLESQEW